MKSELWMNVENAIFFTTPEMGWEENWEMLLFENGDPVADMIMAKKVARETMKDKVVGLATFEQMKYGNAQWDNL